MGLFSFHRVRTEKQLAAALRCTTTYLHQLAENPKYNSFMVTKPGGGKRLIEDPETDLKQVLSHIAYHLQMTYYPIRPAPSHGFIKSPENAESYHIVSNASAHFGCSYLLNIDLDDFFHQVTEDKVARIFQSSHFHFDLDCEALLTKMVCYNGRLPMGSPSSPPLSNYAMLLVDDEIEKWAFGQNITYTRYVDDLTFSSIKSIQNQQIAAIKEILACHRFRPDPEKEKMAGKNDTKEVTGLILTHSGLQLPVDFFDDLNDAIRQTAYISSTLLHLPPDVAYNCLQGMRQSLAGRLAMVKQVYGAHSQVYHKLAAQVKEVLSHSFNPPPPRWRYNGYQW